MNIPMCRRSLKTFIFESLQRPNTSTDVLQLICCDRLLFNRSTENRPNLPVTTRDDDWCGRNSNSICIHGLCHIDGTMSNTRINTSIKHTMAPSGFCSMVLYCLRTCPTIEWCARVDTTCQHLDPSLCGCVANPSECGQIAIHVTRIMTCFLTSQGTDHVRVYACNL